ncbi:MAG: hypothetical protein V3U72_00075 [Candidatus Aenigmarchaeota archaeon]
MSDLKLQVYLNTNKQGTRYTHSSIYNPDKNEFGIMKPAAIFILQGLNKETVTTKERAREIALGVLSKQFGIPEEKVKFKYGTWGL